MDHSPRRFVSVEHIDPDNMVEYALNMKSRGQQIDNQVVPGPMGVICPEPRRAARAPHIVDNLSRFCCKPNSNMPLHKGDTRFGILDIFLTKDDPEDDLDTNNQTGFFCGSPPVRASNPVVHDVQFVRQTPSIISPKTNFHGGKSLTRVERVVPSCGASFGGKPMVRIEGFASGSPKSRCIVPALA
eukprot:TRINITY_DN743_c0_g2_i1.p1 TRINITY_DN743_c0_g2~~TRINITY_DN743_c0_g2_i1.p1  ORF type:complete len:186 (-),score=21.66 TRINITY_DN743_c0_g2_i1:436-993(-)